jgi:hypothetical protein
LLCSESLTKSTKSTKSGFQNQSYFFGVARSTYVGSPFRSTSRVGGGVEKKTAIFVLIRDEIGPTENNSC